MGSYRVEAAGETYEILSERDLTPDEILEAIEGRIYAKSPVIPKTAEKFLAAHPRVAQGTALITRMVAPVVGGVAGAATAGPFGLVPGAMAGGLAGGLAAQEIEKAARLREAESYGTLTADVVLSGIPAARIARGIGAGGKLLLSIQGGARYGLAQRAIEIAVDEGRLITPMEALEAAGTGAAVGGVLKGAGMGVSAGRSRLAKGIGGKAVAPAVGPAAPATPEAAPATPEAAPEAPTAAGEAPAEIPAVPAPADRRTPAGFLLPEWESVGRSGASVGVEPIQWQPMPSHRIPSLAKKIARSPAEQREIEQILESIKPQFEQQTRGRVPDSEVKRVGDLLELPGAGQVEGGRPAGEYQPGQAFNEEELATLSVFAQAAKNRLDDARNAANAVPTDAALAASHTKARQDYARVLGLLGGGFSEAGRATRFARVLLEARAGAPVARGIKAQRVIQGAEKKGLLKKGTNVQELGEKIVEHIDDPVTAARILRGSMRTPGIERIRDWVYFAYLSRPVTHLRNFLGNTEALIESSATGALAAASGEKGIRLGEMGRPAVVGARTGFIRGARKAFEIVANGVTNEDLKDPDFLFRFLRGESATELATLRGISLPGDPIAQRGLRMVTRGVPRALQGMDVMFRTIAREIATHQAAYRKANAQAPGKDLRARRQHLAAKALADPNEAKLVELMGKRAVYQETPGHIARKISELGENGGLGLASRLLVLPFVRTPANLMRRAWQKTPVLGLKSSMNEFQRQLKAEGINPESAAAERFRAQLIGEHAIGYAAIVPLVWMAEKGLMAVTAPEKPAAGARWYEQGKKPGSLVVKVGDESRNVPLSAFGTAGIFANAVGAAVENLNRTGDREGYLDDIATAAGSAALSMRDVSFLNGLREIFDTGLGDFDLKSLSRVVGRKAAGVLIPGVAQEVERVTEPTVRRPTGEEGAEVALEEVMSRAPGLSRRVPPRIGTFGEVRQEATGETVGQRIFSVLTGTSIVTTEPVRAELDRLEAALGPDAEAVGPSPPSDEAVFKFPGRPQIELTEQSLTAYKEALGQARGYVIEREMRNEWYSQKTDDARAKAIRRATRKASERVRANTQAILTRRMPYLLRGMELPPLTAGEILGGR